MARVIKGSGTPQRVPLPSGGGGKRVIGKDVWRAQQDAAEVMRDAEKQRDKILSDGRQAAQRAREEAQTSGAEEAFAQAAQEALEAVRRRAERFGDAADDIRVLALEIARKVLGVPPKIARARVDEILRTGLAKLRARRKLRIQVPAARKDALQRERPTLMARVLDEPDLLIEAVSDVSPGFARVVTEAGGALCAEQAALDRLASALGVDEKAVAPRPTSPSVTVERERQSGGSAFRSTPSDEFDDDETDRTDFLSKSQAPKSREARPLPSATSKAARPLAPVKRAPVAPESEATMALDVSQLRDELEQADDSDEMDLFADDEVQSPSRSR